ncbi:MAG: ATP-binding protein [Chloroflexota bacterium]
MRQRLVPGLTARLRIVLLFVVVAAPLAGAIAWIDQIALAERQASLARERLILARAAASSADTLVEASIAALGSLARRTELIGPVGPEGARTFMLRELALSYFWETLGLYDDQGRNIAVTVEGIPPFSVSLADRPHVRTALDRQRPAVGPADISRGRGVPVVSIAAPVQFENGSRGVLLGALSLERLGSDLREVVVGAPDVRLLVVDSNGRLFIHPDVRVAAQLIDLGEVPGVMAALTGAMYVAREPLLEVESLTAFAPVPAARWGLLVQEPLTHGVGPLERAQSGRDVLLLMLVAVSAWLAWMLGGRVASYQRELVHRRNEAVAAVQVRDQFISVAAHELRTPVTAIKGSAQLGLRRWNHGKLTPDRIEHALQRILTAVNRLDVLISDLLDVARLREGAFPIRPELLDLVQLVTNVLSGQTPDASNARVTLRAPSNPAWVRVDPSRIEQVLDNLLSNALKYSPDGSEILVTVETNALRVTLSISDQGIGLPPGTENRIFEPFGRAPNAVDRQLPGLGLGLYICRRIIEAHGGSLSATSAGEDRGTSMIVSLPLAAMDSSAHMWSKQKLEA